MFLCRYEYLGDESTNKLHQRLSHVVGFTYLDEGANLFVNLKQGLKMFWYFHKIVYCPEDICVFRLRVPTTKRRRNRNE